MDRSSWNVQELLDRVSRQVLVRRWFWTNRVDRIALERASADRRAQIVISWFPTVPSACRWMNLAPITAPSPLW